MKMKLFAILTILTTTVMLQAQIKKGSDISPFPYPLEMLVSKDKIDERIKEAARELENDYQGKEVIFLCVMKGALFFTSDLLKEVNLPATLEYVRASSYGENGTVSGKLTLKGIENVNITDKHVIVLDDICDTGKTMTKVMAELKKLHPASLKSMVLLSKNVRSKQDYHPDYALFDIQNRFVVGYGLDYKEYYRNLDAIYILGYSD